MKAKKLDEVAHLFGMSPETANERASLQDLPVPAFRLGSQKSPWMVLESDLDRLVEDRAQEARKEHKNVNAA